MTGEEIIARLPYQHPFLFVNRIDRIDENGVEGSYYFNESAFFYEGHFKDNPITPGVILTESMAQIGVVSLGIYLLGKKAQSKRLQLALTHSNIEFINPVYPNSSITVFSEKQYFRFGKLKCKVKCTNDRNVLIAQGEISGILKEIDNE